MADVGAQEAVLFFGGGVDVGVAAPGGGGVVVVVAPFGEVVGELQAGRVGVRVFKVDDDELLVRIGGQQERRCARGQKTEDVSVLSLNFVSSLSDERGSQNVHRCGQRHSENAVDPAPCIAPPTMHDTSAPSA